MARLRLNGKSVMKSVINAFPLAVSINLLSESICFCFVVLHVCGSVVVLHEIFVAYFYTGGDDSYKPFIEYY